MTPPILQARSFLSTGDLLPAAKDALAQNKLLIQPVTDGAAPEKDGKTEVFNQLIAPARLENAKLQVQNHKNRVETGGSGPV